MTDVTFIMHSDWLQNIEAMSVEEQDKIIAEIVRYGTGMPLQYEDDKIVASIVNFVKSSIDFSKDKYAQKIEGGKKSTKGSKINNEEVWKLAREGKNSSEIAKIIGCSKSSIDHSAGWKNRNMEVFFDW